MQAIANMSWFYAIALALGGILFTTWGVRLLNLSEKEKEEWKDPVGPLHKQLVAEFIATNAPSKAKENRASRVLLLGISLAISGFVAVLVKLTATPDQNPQRLKPTERPVIMEWQEPTH